MNEIHSEEYKGYTIRIELDEASGTDSPRDWDNLGTIVAWHSRYALSDSDAVDIESQDFPRWAEENGFTYYNLFAYEHGNIALSLSESLSEFSCPWDSGQVGYVYVTPEKIAECYGEEIPSEEKIRENLKSEIEVYASWINGEVYGYIVESPDGEEIDSCWGFIGDWDYPIEEAKAAVKYHLESMHEAEQFVVDHFAI